MEDARSSFQFERRVCCLCAARQPRVGVRTMLRIATVAMLAVLGISVLFAQQALADKSHDRKVVSVKEGAAGKDGTLVMTDKDGKNEHSHMIASTVKITLEKKEVKLTDLKKGDAIKVTTDDAGKVKEVAATRK